jgi:hypothetical protein
MPPKMQTNKEIGVLSDKAVAVIFGREGSNALADGN